MTTEQQTETLEQIADRIAGQFHDRFVFPSVATPDLTKAIVEALRNERERCAKVINNRGRELRRMANAPLLEEAVSTRFKSQSAICDELTQTIREGN